MVLAGGRDANSTVLNAVELYEVQTNLWSPLPPLTTPRDGAAAASLQDLVMVVGGRGTYSTTDTAETWRLGSSQWEEEPARMKTARSCCAAVSLQKYELIVVIGGRGSAYSELKSVEAFDLETREWRSLAPMNTPRMGCVAVPVGESKILVAGGLNDSEWVDTMEMYDVLEDNWVEMPVGLPEKCGFSAGTIIQDNGNSYFVLLGGKHAAQRPMDQAICYSLELQRWRYLPALTEGREGGYATAAGHVVKVFAGNYGSNGAAPTRLAEEMVLTPFLRSTWTEVHNHGSEVSVDSRQVVQENPVSVQSGALFQPIQPQAPHSQTPAVVAVPIRNTDQAGQASAIMQQQNHHSHHHMNHMNPHHQHHQGQPNGNANNHVGNTNGGIPTTVHNNGSNNASSSAHTQQQQQQQGVVSEAQVVHTQTLDDVKKTQPPPPTTRGGKLILRKVERLLMTHNGKKVWYTGQVNEHQKPQGKGIMWNDEDGSKYMGEWWDGMREGEGKTFFAQKQSMHYGSYHRDKRHGKGKFGWKDRRVYEGDFIEDRREGRGTLTWPDGTKYEGEFRRGGPNGMGQMTFADGTVYDGQFIKGKFDGFGVCHYSDGRVYRGEFREVSKQASNDKARDKGRKRRKGRNGREGTT